MSKGTTVATALLFATAWGPVVAQDEATGSAPIFRESVEVEVVNVEVFVSDRRGVPVTGLGRDDFHLFVDGEEVEVPYFRASDRGAPAPGLETEELPLRPSRESVIEVTEEGPGDGLHVALVIDNAHIRAVNRKRVFRDLRTFLSSRLPADARLTVVSLEPGLVVHADFSTDRGIVGQILDALEEVAARPAGPDIERRQILDELSTTGRIYNRSDYATGGLAPDPQSLLVRVRAWAESEFSRTLSTVQVLGQVVGSLAGVPGRKALVYVSDGLPTRPGEEMFEAWNYRYGDASPAPQGFRSAGMTADYQRDVGRFDLLPHCRQLAELANAAGVTWYAIDAESDHGGTLRSAATAGGVATEVMEALDTNLREPVETIATATGGRRLQMGSDGLDLNLLGADFRSSYSLGFVPKKGAGAKARSIRVEVARQGVVVRHRESWTPTDRDDAAARSMLAALLYHTVANPLQVTTSVGQAQPIADGGYHVPVEIAVPLRQLVVLPGEGVHSIRLSVFVSSRDGEGRPRPVQKLPFGADIPSDVLEQALEDAVRYTLPVVLRTGDQDLALGVRDELGQAASYLRLDVRDLVPPAD